MGTAIKAEDGTSYRNARGKPFTSDLSGQAFWTLDAGGHVPLGLVMGTCVYHIAHRGIGQTMSPVGQNAELPNYTQALYDARELAMTRMQDEANRLGATGIVEVKLDREVAHVGQPHDRVPRARHRGDQAPRGGHAAQADHHHLARQLMVGETDGSDLGGPPPDAALGPPGGPKGDLPEAALRRLESDTFSSGLSVPDFAACLDLGLQPVALVQGFCVMQWGWYGPGSRFQRGLTPYAGYGSGGGAQTPDAYTETYRCPHGFVSTDHRAWGQNLEQPWVEDAWAQGYGAAYGRMLEEATQHGAHGVIGVVDQVSNVADSGTTEFHFLGTAIVVEDGPPPAGGTPWSTYLAGQRLTKSIEAGFMPVAVVAALASVRVWAYCMTEYQMEGPWAGGRPPSRPSSSR